MSREILRKILVELGIDEERIVDGARLFSDLQIDSTEAVEVSLSLKKACGVNVKLDGASDLRIADLCAVVDQALAARQTVPAVAGDAE